MASSPASKRRRKDQSEEKAAEEAPRTGSSPVVVFAHGAGAPSTSEWMVRWKEMLDEALDAVEVVTFDYPYISGGKRKAPPRAEKLVDHHLGVVKDAVTKYPGHPLILVGKSMGSRVSCMVAGAECVNVSAVICLGYPLKGMNGAIRDETLLQLRTPTFFVQGSKDGLCPLDKLATTCKKMKCINELHVIDGGDHSFKIGKKYQESAGLSQGEAERRAVKAISEFVTKCI
ncbi:uncharacterized protein [Elaeis guineensis]|uniref:uncharacterized protein n=1 Tax=Elaeis guineensis var. tenera TaxID=51953 RepID=UPI003C6D2039